MLNLNKVELNEKRKVFSTVERNISPWNPFVTGLLFSQYFQVLASLARRALILKPRVAAKAATLGEGVPQQHKP